MEQPPRASLKTILKEKTELVIGRGKALEKWKFKENQYQFEWNSVQDQLGMEAEKRINMQLLRDAMDTGNPILDISAQSETGGFYLNAEREYLTNRGWIYDATSRYWTYPNYPW
jgi:hypothetical protein